MNNRTPSLSSPTNSLYLSDIEHKLITLPPPIQRTRISVTRLPSSILQIDFQCTTIWIWAKISVINIKPFSNWFRSDISVKGPIPMLGRPCEIIFLQSRRDYYIVMNELYAHTSLNVFNLGPNWRRQIACLALKRVCYSGPISQLCIIALIHRSYRFGMCEW